MNICVYMYMYMYMYMYTRPYVLFGGGQVARSVSFETRAVGIKPKRKISTIRNDDVKKTEICVYIYIYIYKKNKKK